MNLRLICIVLTVTIPHCYCQTSGGVNFKKAYEIFLKLLDKGTSLDKFIEATFPDGDANKDGVTDLEEATEFYKTMNKYRKDAGLKFQFYQTAEELFKPVDANEDGQITPAEFATYMKGNRKPYFVLVGFRHFDLDQNGKLNGKELIAVRTILTQSGAGDFVKEEEAKAKRNKDN